MSKLEQLINEQYNYKLSQAETQEARRNLVGFFELLLKIDTRQKQEELIKEKQSNIDVDYDKNNRSSN